MPGNEKFPHLVAVILIIAGHLFTMSAQGENEPNFASMQCIYDFHDSSLIGCQIGACSTYVTNNTRRYQCPYNFSAEASCECTYIRKVPEFGSGDGGAASCTDFPGAQNPNISPIPVCDHKILTRVQVSPSPFIAYGYGLTEIEARNDAELKCKRNGKIYCKDYACHKYQERSLSCLVSQDTSNVLVPPTPGGPSPTAN